MSQWKKIAQVNSDGATLNYNITGTAEGLVAGKKIGISGGGTGKDFSGNTDGLIYKDRTTQTIELLPFPDPTVLNNENHFLQIGSSGDLSWIPETTVTFTPQGEYVLQNGDAVLQNLTVNGTLDISSGAVYLFEGNDITTSSQTIVLDSNADATSGHIGITINLDETAANVANDPEFYWDVDNTEWRVQTHLDTNEYKVGVVHSNISGTPPASTGNVGDFCVNDSSELYIKVV